MFRYQLQISTGGLIICFMIDFQHQARAKPVENLIEVTPSTTTAAARPKETTLVNPSLPSYYYMGPLLMPFPISDQFLQPV
ncbi:unnamed protein product [Rotaria magnacalcarata]|uniref:Uncharacterized protein n=1 Tax=Rotaria magnacalcarata TaxID=392030 RepID=A0A816FG66_9BILA|nr:unnamed protein product [Rotaria magnacalcarata]CAF1661066.1 unnamed protein product [Rotaria magnacalcarata]CAF5035414.1 unnamed protein product [Rotaria magnacalcarata]CAF5093921.1 unnamed protein product [Rotaria magnacalcarata]